MMLTPPIPFGHELAGTVVEVGAGVTKFAVGDRVVALNSAPCDVCFFCRHGQQNLCEDLLFNNGAYAELHTGFRRGLWRRIRCWFRMACRLNMRR